MKRFFTSLATFSLAETIGRHPAMAGALMLLGVGGGAVVSGMLTTPTITPFVSSNFNPNHATTNNGLKTNGGAAGALAIPPGNTGGYTGSFGLYFEANVNPNLGGTEAPFSGLFLSATGQPSFGFQRIINGSFNGSNFWQGTSASVSVSSVGSNYSTGLYPWTASGGGCAREPTAVWFGNNFNISVVDPGFGCQTAPTLNAVNIPNSGAQQATGAGAVATTCAVVNSQAVVTAHVAVAHGLAPGLTYAMGGFTPTGYNSATYTALPGTTGTTLVGTTGATSCPAAVTVEGTALSGTGATFTFSTGIGGTGITTKAGQHVCGIIGEYGDDSPFPGAHFLSMVDDKGNVLPGAPALVQTPNMGTADFIGSTSIGSTTLNVSALNPHTITSAAWALGSGNLASTGLVTFQVSSNPGYVAGTQFTVSGMSPSSVNGTYVAVVGTSSTQVVGNQLTGPGGVPQAYANPGTITTASTPQMVSVIFPGMWVFGSTPTHSTIGLYGAGGTSGTGGVGTYQLSASQTAAITSGSTIVAYAPFYYTVASGGTGPGTTTVSAQASFQPGDFTPVIGTTNTALVTPQNGWGGALGNFAMLTGAPVPSQAGGAPSTSDLASLCTKATDIQAYAAAKSLKVQSLYRLNDPGIWGDSSIGTVPGYIDTISGTTGLLHVVGSPLYGVTLPTTGTGKLSGPGLPLYSSTASSPTVLTATVNFATNVVTFPTGTTAAAVGSSSSPVRIAIGAFLPALPIQSSTFKGYIDTTSGVSTLHLTSFDDGTAHSGFVSFTGSLGTEFTASITPCTGSNGCTTGGLLTATLPGGSPPLNAYLGIGTQVVPTIGCSSGCVSPTTVTGFATSPATPGAGYNGSYVVDVSQTVASQVMFGHGQIPGPATAMDAPGETAGAWVAGMAVSDGNNLLTGSPLLMTGIGATGIGVAGNYYAPFTGDTHVIGTLSTAVPGEYIQNSAITNPVKIASYQAGAIGLLGNYTLSGPPNAAGSVGSSGSPVVFTGTTITDGAAIAPGPALTIKDQGPAITFPLTNISAKTGTIALSGTYDTGTLGGTPSGIQALVSNSANGPPLAGCTPCNWGALTGTISGGKWSGTIGPIPGGGPYIVSVRAANGTAYATLPSSIKVGWVFALWGQGQAGSISSAQSGTYTSYFSGLWGWAGWGSVFGNANELYLTGPPIVGNFVPSASFQYAGDRFGVGSAGQPLSEAFSAFEQELLNAYGVPASFLQTSRDGVGVGPSTLGNVTQTQTVGAGDGSTLAWCSASKFCASAGVSPEGPLVFGAASLTGGWFTGATITNPSSVPTFSAGTRAGGALEPGMVLNTPNSPSLVRCLTGCSSQMNFGSSTWLLSNSLDTGATPTRADAPASLLPFGATTTPWPNFNIQQGGTLVYGFNGFGVPLVKAGTFQISVNGSVVCQDSATFAYNQPGGNCTGATIASSFVNYQTGDYQITFTSGNAPASNAAIVATWTNIISPESFSTSLNRPQGLDFFGDSTGSQSGADAALFARAPGGVNGQIFSGLGTDLQYIINSGGPSNAGYQYGGLTYSQMVSWLYDAKFPALVPGMTTSVPLIVTGQWRDEGPLFFFGTNATGGIYDQWAEDITTKSTFSGTVASSVLTLSADAVGPMWEGEILGCVTLGGGCTIGPLSGVYITGLSSTSPAGWGKATSTYTLAGASSVSSNGAMQNPVYYSGSGPAYFAGTGNDVLVQNQGLAGTLGENPHTGPGFTGGRRATSRWAAMIYCHNGGNCDDPKLSRANDVATGTPSPAFDYSSTYQATFSTATWTGNTVTISGGLAAHARPFVVGQALSCASCASGLVITSLSVPPTQSTATGAGEVGQTFTFTAKNAAGAVIGGSGSGSIAAGCTTGSGGSNCINIDIALNVSGATAIDTCGANNINGNAPNYVTAAGKCQGNGIGEIVRSFRIGTNQLMHGNVGSPSTGSVYDDGADYANGSFNRNAAFTCNIVAATVVQCVKGAAYSSGVLSGVGLWSSGSTYVAYGDWLGMSGRLASLLGYVGGQSFPFTPGSGYTPGQQLGVVGTGCGVTSGGVIPTMDITIGASGSIVSAVPSSAASAVGLGVGTSCTFTPTGGTGGSVGPVTLAPVEGQGGIGTFATDSNTMGMFLYDNSGEVGNPLNQFFTNGMGGYFEPGLPVRPFGMFAGAAVSG
jgi:hypothetical protein